MCVYTVVCVYIYMRKADYHDHKQDFSLRTHIYTYICICVYMCLCVYTYICIFVNVYVCICICVHICVYIYICI